MHGRISRKVGTDDLSHLDLVEGLNPVKRFIRENQIRSIEKRKELMDIYNAQQQGEEIRRASREIRKQENESKIY